jgi:hypothetical protein
VNIKVVCYRGEMLRVETDVAVSSASGIINITGI